MAAAIALAKYRDEKDQKRKVKTAGTSLLLDREGHQTLLKVATNLELHQMGCISPGHIDTVVDRWHDDETMLNELHVQHIILRREKRMQRQTWSGQTQKSRG